MFMGRCYPHCLQYPSCTSLVSSCGAQAAIPLLPRRSEKPRAGIERSTELLQKVTQRRSSWEQVPITQMHVWCTDLKINPCSLWAVTVRYSLHLAFARCILTSYGAAQLQSITWADQTKPAYTPTSNTSSHWKWRQIFVCVCVCVW